MKVFVTKYALSNGIKETDCKISEQFPDMAVDGLAYHHKPDWHENKEDAIIQAEKMRVAKIASLKKQLNKLEKLKFD